MPNFDKKKKKKKKKTDTNPKKTIIYDTDNN